MNCGFAITAVQRRNAYDRRWSRYEGGNSMRLGHVLTTHRIVAVTLLAALAIVSADNAQARSNRQQKVEKQQKAEKKHTRVVHGSWYKPPYAAFVIDDKSGQVLHEENADAPRHPASLTKVMTLYLLFEQLESGKIKLDTPLAISEHAAAAAPVKLGLKPNGTIKAEEALKAMVTKSANDAARVVAEAIGGTEDEFAKLMTEKAKSLGMAGTVYVNASGLPAEEQITTARDQAVLGRSICHRFPTYYRYFATPSFAYRGKEMHNHNALLATVKGVDGIKTGFTEASGYNLLSSLRRDEKHLVAVVLGGTSNGQRDTRMRQLLEEHIRNASVTRTVPKIIEPPAGYELASEPAGKTPAAKPAASSDPGAQGAFASTKAEKADAPKLETEAKKPKDRHLKAQPIPAKAKPSDGKPSANLPAAPMVGNQL
jgi:D-alanyl-D-alanine carboxypeptidase